MTDLVLLRRGELCHCPLESREVEDRYVAESPLPRRLSCDSSGDCPSIVPELPRLIDNGGLTHVAGGTLLPGSLRQQIENALILDGVVGRPAPPGRVDARSSIECIDLQS